MTEVRDKPTADAAPIATAARGKAAVPPKRAASVIDGVEVALDVFIGTARMTVGELTALSAEDVITLDAALNAAVEVRLNGVTIGHGELVAADDRFAVRLTALAT